jgi:hypothetical protein
VSYAIVQDMAASWVEYKRAVGALVDPAPRGLTLYVAGATDEGVRAIAVWESEEAWQLFRTGRLAPALALVGGGAEPSVRELRPLQLVVGRPIQVAKSVAAAGGGKGGGP